MLSKLIKLNQIHDNVRYTPSMAPDVWIGIVSSISHIWENGIKDVIQSDDRQWPLKLSVILSISMALGPFKIKVGWN